ncbi:MAG: 50S ribosomal protein L11 methyltransferase [Candidatus Omnitrophica bacterium]|nr:50S ribosomal protein L11 methyltransferase [Candidatus Omnitrophota bacterium]
MKTCKNIFISIILILPLLVLARAVDLNNIDFVCSQNAAFLKYCLSPNIQINNSTIQYLFSFRNFPSGHTLNTEVITEDGSFSTKQILIKEQNSDYVQNIEIVDFEQDKTYYNWIVNQYEERTLANYPYIATKVIINAMIAEKEVFEDAIVLDAGSGDGSLSILSKKLGAKKVYGIEWSKDIMSIAQISL